MTVRQKLEKYLTDKGLWPEEAMIIFDTMLKEQLSGMKNIKWNDFADIYPTSLYALLIIYLEEFTLKWIDTNKPRHFARPMFERK